MRIAMHCGAIQALLNGLIIIAEDGFIPLSEHKTATPTGLNPQALLYQHHAQR